MVFLLLLRFRRLLSWYFRDNLFHSHALIVLDPKRPFLPGHPSNALLCCSSKQKVAKIQYLPQRILYQHDLTLSRLGLCNLSSFSGENFLTLRSRFDTDIKQNVQHLVRLLGPVHRVLCLCQIGRHPSSKP